MQRVSLIYNPVAGKAQNRARIIAAISETLANHGVDAHSVATTHAGSAAAQAREAIAQGADTIFACGGDGTVHDVLQALLHQPASLGIIPLGSANVLARHLGLSMDPLRAAIQQLAFTPRSVPVGELRYSTATGEATRNFLALAGCGPDGALVYRMAGTGKQRLGRLGYYLRAARLFATGRFRTFAVQYTLTDGETISTQAVSAMAVRVGDLGGVFSPLIRGGSVEHGHLRLTLLKGPAIASLPTWFAASHLRLHRHNSFVETLEVTSFRCGSGARAQADGEALGTTPMQARLILDAINLLMPA